MSNKQPELMSMIATLFPSLDLILPAEILSEFTDAKPDNLPLFHFGLGLFLRNNFLNQGSELYNAFFAAGIRQKDDMSSLILQLFHSHLHDR